MRDALMLAAALKQNGILQPAHIKRRRYGQIQCGSELGRFRRIAVTVERYGHIIFLLEYSDGATQIALIFRREDPSTVQDDHKASELLIRLNADMFFGHKRDHFCLTSKMSHDPAWREPCSSTDRDK